MENQGNERIFRKGWEGHNHQIDIYKSVEPCLNEEVGDPAHVGAEHKEVRRQGHAADDVSLPRLREDLGLPVLGDDALALQVVELDLAVVPTQYTVDTHYTVQGTRYTVHSDTQYTVQGTGYTVHGKQYTVVCIQLYILYCSYSVLYLTAQESVFSCISCTVATVYST